MWDLTDEAPDAIVSCGFDGYLSKPVNASSLAQELDRILAKGSQAVNPCQAHEEQPAEKAGAVGGTAGATGINPFGST
jgi:hypothetical protein